MINRNKKGLGEILLESGLITQSQLDEVLKKQKVKGKKLGELLIEEDIINERQLIEALEYQLKVPYIDLTAQSIDPEIPRLIGESLARRHMLIPVAREDNQLTVAMVDPLNLYAIDDVNIATGLNVKPTLALRNHIQNAIDQYYGKESAEKAVEDFTREIGLEQITEIEEEILNEVTNAPVVRLVDSIIQHAVRARASDIHIEPFEKNIRIRFRIDGELQEIMTSSKTAHSAIVTRIKIIGRMDIAEKRIPQDGRVDMNIDNKDIDLRISVLPTVYGEKIVLRLLDRSSTILTKTQLGFSAENIRMFDKLIQSPNGIILVTGPTGSGKTTTLYAVLQELNKIGRNIITVEDPVEYRLEGINQVQVNIKAGLTFASGLRSILRQDPDIIMIGEIRDTETAKIAVRAAITGHLVLSTMHTNDSASAVSRLVDMGIEPYLVSSSVVGVVAQRLVKKICTNCKIEYKPSHSEMDLLQLNENDVLYKGQGCSLCNNAGYKGRTAIHEILLMTRELREMVDRHDSIDELRNAAAKYGTINLRDSCSQLVRSGITTSDEMLKVTYSLD
ncbi:MAG: GspE/PulE family protein [Caldicoprobacterales bacterium]|jgi:type IV pilus assembly protein PilB|nr:Flp pilus assembly complex ATPase component TadA [Clostridiales bacterium]